MFGLNLAYIQTKEHGMKKVAIIGTAGIPARYGGFETLAHHLVENLNTKFDFTVYCSEKFYAPEERKSHFNGAKLVYLPLNANGLQSIIYDIWSIIHALFYADSLIVLGVSGCIMLPFIKLFTKKKIIVNIDGLEWKRGKWSLPIKKFLQFSERMAIKFSDADITDNAAIKRYTALTYKTLSYLVEYGADHVLKVKAEKEDINKYPFLNSNYAFKVCRIEPENNVHTILGAFSQIPSKTLVVVGNWNKSEYGIQLKEKYKEFHNIILFDPIYNQRELDVLRSNCHVYIHGHSAGGTNPSLVEAMYLGLPVIAFDVSYNIATTENKALYFTNESSLVQLLKSINGAELFENKTWMEKIAERRYTWKIIASKYEALVLGFDFNYHKKPLYSRLANLPKDKLTDMGMAHLHQHKLFFE